MSEQAAAAPAPSPNLYLRLVGLGVVIGIPAAFVAALFLAVVHDLEGWLWDGDATAWYLVIGLPAVGAAIVYLARRFLPGDGGNPPIEGIGGAPARVRDAPGIALAAIATLSFGAILGPEAPLIALGSIVGLTVTLFTKVGERQKRVLGTAGSFSAISALFGGPVVAGTMMVEGGLEMGARLLPVLLPGFVAAASGYLLFVGFGNWGGLHEQGLAVPNLPAYHGEHLRDLIVAVVVGILAALTISGVRRLSAAVSGIGVGLAILLVAGGLTVGLLAQIADWLGASSQDVLFSGQAGVPALATADSTKIVLILFVAKALGYAVSLGCGFRGGPIFPAVFLGIALATFAVVWFDVSPTLAVAVGAAAGMAAGTQLLITSTLFASLLVGDAGPDAIPAAVFAAAAAWLTMRALAARSNPVAPIT
ncbi:MAG TPA: chloride channel protein [Gaiellaceae bacterium]|nr:chloride channel protein [Gaiellaceae bacterium]